METQYKKILICAGVLVAVIALFFIIHYLGKSQSEPYIDYDKMYNLEYNTLNNNLSLEQHAPNVDDPQHNFDLCRNCGGSTYSTPRAYYSLLADAEQVKYKPKKPYPVINILPSAMIYRPPDGTYQEWYKYRPYLYDGMPDVSSATTATNNGTSGSIGQFVPTHPPLTADAVPTIKTLVYQHDDKLYKTDFGQTDYNKFMTFVQSNYIKNYKIQAPEPETPLTEDQLNVVSAPNIPRAPDELDHVDGAFINV